MPASITLFLTAIALLCRRSMAGTLTKGRGADDRLAWLLTCLADTLADTLAAFEHELAPMCRKTS